VEFSWDAQAPVLGGLDFQAAIGEITAIVGTSGCGKSTLLRLAAGLLIPTGGRVENDLYGGEEERGQGFPTAFVFQHPTLLPWRTLEENVAIPLEIWEESTRGQSSVHGTRDKVAQALARVGLEEHAHKLPRQLSGGMQMRASLARATVTQPRLVLLDEPFSSLDALTRVHLQEAFLALWRESRFTTLLVTHDVEEALRLADKVLVLGGEPASIQASFEVPFPRPRHPDLRYDTALGALARQVEAAL
jgi:NitT/TauT family transport system ATP-binding protein